MILTEREMKIKINGKEIACKKDETILQVAQKVGIHIPTLCHDARLEPYGGCRLCIVEIEGSQQTPAFVHYSCDKRDGDQD